VSGTQVIVMAKAPVAGRVKTRLCPPCTPAQAAAVAAAALADTLDVVATARAGRRILAIDGAYAVPPGWDVLPQRGDSLGERLAHAFADVYRPGVATLLVGMDTPQLSAAELDEGLGQVVAPGGPEAVLGLAEDGGWWALGLGDGRHAAALAGVTMSTSRTGADTRDALRSRGLRVGALNRLTDVDTGADAHAVAALCPAGSRFRAAVAANVPAPAGLVAGHGPAGGGR
jgi:glycosyltransferase A (GT-A) superfamily protein (DUF2064 family)